LFFRAIPRHDACMAQLLTGCRLFAEQEILIFVLNIKKSYLFQHVRVGPVVAFLGRFSKCDSHELVSQAMRLSKLVELLVFT
jgi:hypothetical protein